MRFNWLLQNGHHDVQPVLSELSIGLHQPLLQEEKIAVSNNGFLLSVYIAYHF